ncbi:hypothetical protein [Streptomyces sp. NPDC050738]|uniref:hypothetical protein n=1 Tax=Streptomyces sp. NPDC050738 TaxID=3154744 RepID=UPI003419C198
MSDEYENRSIASLRRLRDLYAMLLIAFGKLPIPVALPTKFEGYTQIQAAVERAYALLPEQPMTGRARDLLSTAALYWLTAAEMVIAYEIDHKGYKADAVILSVIAGESYVHDFFHLGEGEI